MAMCPRLRTRPIGIGRSTTTRSDECSDPVRTSPSLHAPSRLHAGRNQAFVARAMALVHVPSLTFGCLSPQGAACQRGPRFVTSPRTDVARWSIDPTTRRRTPSPSGNSSRVRQPAGSPERTPENPRSERTRGAADRAVERFLGPTVEKITRVVLTSRTGLSRDTPWLEILDALEQLEGRHGFDPGLVATLRWLAQSPSESNPRPATGEPPASSGKRSTK